MGKEKNLIDGECAESARERAARFEAHILQDHKRLMQGARRLCHNTRIDPDDLYSEARLRALRGFHNFKEDSSFVTWFQRIMLNQKLDTFRKPSSGEITMDHTAAEFMLLRPDSAKPFEEIETFRSRSVVTIGEDIYELGPFYQGGRDVTGQMVAAIEEVWKKQKSENADGVRMLLLFSVDEVPYEEISEIMEIPLGTVKSGIRSAKRKIEKAFRGKASSQMPPQKRRFQRSSHDLG